MATTSEEAITFSSVNAGLVPSDWYGKTVEITVSERATTTGYGEAASARGEELSSTGKEDSSEFRGSMSPAPSGSSHTSPSQLIGSHSLPINVFPLTVDTLQD